MKTYVKWHICAHEDRCWWSLELTQVGRAQSTALKARGSVILELTSQSHTHITHLQRGKRASDIHLRRTQTIWRVHLRTLSVSMYYKSAQSKFGVWFSKKGFTDSLIFSSQFNLRALGSVWATLAQSALGAVDVCSVLSEYKIEPRPWDQENKNFLAK